MQIIHRAALIEELAAHVCAGYAVLAYGPRGIGASTVLDGCAAKVAGDGRRVVRIAHLASFADLIEPLSRAYVGEVRPARERLHAAISREPGAVLVDRVERAGAKLRREIRELGAIGLGAILVGQADTPREHARLRALRLAHREIAIPPLGRGAMREILDAQLAPELAARLSNADRERVLGAVVGRPGMLAALLGRLAHPRYWRGGRAAVDLAVTDLAMADIATPRSGGC
jgi:hypothetical protein